MPAQLRKGQGKGKLGAADGGSGASSPLGSPRQLSRLAERKAADPEAFHAQFSGAVSRTNSTELPPTGGDRGGDSTAMDGEMAGRDGNDQHEEPPAAAVVADGSPPEHAVDSLVSHTGRLVGKHQGLRARHRAALLRAKNSAAFEHAGAAAGEVMFDGDRSEKFPLAFERRHINKWLVAERSGKSFDELDRLSRQARILQLIHGLTRLRLGNLGLLSCRGLEDLPLRHVVRIHLAHNRISTIEGFQDLPSLEFLNLSFNLLSGLGNLRSLLKLRALDVGFNVLESVEAGELPTSLRFLVTEGNPLGAMTLNSWKSFFHFQPLLLSHNTMPIENFLQRMTEADAAGKRPAVHAASADTGDDAHQPANRPLENTPRCHSRPVRFLPRTHTPRLVRPQPQAAHSHAAPTDALALTCHTHPLKGASLARQYFRAHPDISGAVGPSAPRRASLHEKTLQDAERGEAEQEGEWVHAFARSPAPGDSLDWREVWGDSRDSQGAREGGEGDVANAEVGGGVGGEEAGGHVAAAAEDLERRDGAPREPCAPEEACGAAETARESGKGMGEGEAGGQQQGTQPEPEEPAQQPRAPDDARDAPMACETELRSAAKRPKTSADVVAGEGTRETVRVSHVDDPDLGLIQVTERQAVLVALPDDSKAVYGGLDKWRRDEAEFRRRANESSGNFIDPVTQLRINRRSAASRAEAVTMQGLRQSQAAALEHVAVSLASVRACLATPRPLTAPGQRRVVPQHTSHAHKSALSTVADGMGDADEQDAAESLEIQELIHELMHGELQVPSRKPSPRDGEKTRAPQGAGLLPGDEGPASSTGGYVQRVSSRGTQWVQHNLNFPPEEYVFRPLSGTKGPASAVAHASKLSVRKVEALGSPQVVRARPGRQEGAAGTRWLASPMSLSTESISPLASPMSFRSKWLFQRLQPRHSDALDQGDKVLEHLPDGSEASPPAW